MSALMQYLRGRGVTFVVIPNGDDPVRTAAPISYSPADVVKTVPLATAVGCALCVVPDGRALDLELARAALHDPAARTATPEELGRWFPDYELGALPPLGLFFLAPMYVDPAVADRRSVVFRAGKHRLSIAMSTKALFRDDPIVITPLTSETARAEADVTRLERP